MSGKGGDHLHDLGLIIEFKAISDLPTRHDENNQVDLAKFLWDERPVERLNRYKFQIGNQEVDFSYTGDL